MKPSPPRDRTATPAYYARTAVTISRTHGGALRQCWIFLDCGLDAGKSSLPIPRIHHRPKREPGIQREEPGFRDSWYGRRVREVEEYKSSSLAIAVRKIRGFRLHIRENRLNGGAELALASQFVGSFRTH